MATMEHKQRDREGQWWTTVSETGTKCKEPDLDYEITNEDYDQPNDCKRNRNNDALRKTPPSGCQVTYKTEKNDRKQCVELHLLGK